MKTYLTILVVVFLSIAAMPTTKADPPPSMQYINQILRPCASGATPYAKVETNPGGTLGNVDITTCVGGNVRINGTAISGGGGITSLNTLVAAVQTFAVGTAGSDFNVASSVSTHTFNLPNASATARGVISTGAQTIAGNKTFTGAQFVIKGSAFFENGASADIFRYNDTTNEFKGAANALFSFSSTASNANAATDTALARNAAGVVEVNSGVAGTFADLRAKRLQVTVTTVASLPTCNAGSAGSEMAVSNALAPTFLTAVVGGGAVTTPVFCDGTNWVAY